MLDSPEKVLEQLAALMKEHQNADVFTVRVNGRKPGAMVPVAFAVFNEATLNHIAQAESWVGRLLGGGEWILSINHAANLGRRFAFSVNVPGPTYSQPDWAAISSQDWLGPTNYVATGAAQQGSQQTVLNPTQQAQQGTGVSFNITRPTGPASIPVTGAGAQAAMSSSPAETDRLLLIQREENRARSELEAAKAQLLQQQTEARLRKEADEREAKLRAEMLANKKPEKEGPSAMEVIAAAAAAFAPIVSTLIQSNNDFRRATLEMQQRQAEAQAASQERQMALLLKLTERPNGSPEMTAMLEMTKAQAESQGVMMGRIVDAMSVVSKTSVGMIETIAEISAPPEGSPVLDAVKEGTKALLALAGGAESGARKAIKTQQQLPAATQAAQVQQAQAQQARAHAQAQARQQQAQQLAQQQADARAQRQAQHVAQQTQAQATMQPVEVKPEPKPVEVVAFKDDPKPNMPAAFDDMPDGFASVPSKSIVDELEELIRNEHQPVGAVVQFLIDSLKHPEMQHALNEVGGDPSALLAKRLGVEWVLGHQEYLTELGETLEKMGTEQGIFADDGDDNNGEEEAR